MRRLIDDVINIFKSIH